MLVADDLETGARVAVKIATGTAAVDALAREARALAVIRHPRVPTVVHGLATMDPDGDAPRALLVTTFCEGRPLAVVLESSGPTTSEAWLRAVLRGLLDAVGAAHEAGVIHGDVTTSNCVVDDHASVHLLDFDASWVVTDPWSAPRGLGTPTTMAPELGQGAPPSIASDLYAVACVAYELLVGQPPFVGSTSDELLARHAREAPRAPRTLRPHGEVPATLERAILRGLAKDPASRFASAADFLRALDGPPAAALVPVDEDLRRRLLARVRSQWIEGFLERTTDGVIMVRQQLALHARSGEQDASGDRSGNAALVTTEVLRAAMERHPMLLLLGDAGHGKTVNLLRVARVLAAEAERDDGAPVPVVFTVSSWRRQPRLDDWFADELVSRYGLTRTEARRVLALGGVVPLLDGLDDLPRAGRAAMVSAIQAQRSKAPSTRMVVTCRTSEHLELGAEGLDAHVVELSPLRAEDVLRQLRAAEQTALLTALATSAPLSGLASTPMFLHVMRVSFRDSSAFRMALGSDASTIAALFDAFVDVAERRLLEEVGPMPALRGHLAAVAALFRRTGRTMLFFEDLQPAALPSTASRLIYAFASRGLTSGLFALSVILPITFTPLDNGGLETSLAFTARLAAIGWLVLTTTFGLLALRTTSPGRAPRASGVGASLAVALAVGAITALALVLAERHPMAGFLGFEIGFVGALVLGLSRRARRGADDDIVAAEEIRWSLRQVRPAHLASLVLVSVALLLGFHQLYTATSGVYMAGAIFAVGLTVLGFRAKAQELRPVPNAGIHRTARNALSAGALCLAATTFLFGLSYGPLYGSFVGLTIGVVVALWFGGIDVVHHAVLRLQLHLAGVLRFDAGRHLEAAVAAGLMRRVGNGYIFMHATLTDHLAKARPSGGASEAR